SIAAQRELHAGRHFEVVGRREYRHVRHCPEAGDVLGALMAGPERAVDHAGAVADEDYRQVFVTDIELDLLQDTDGHESAEAVNYRPQTAFGESRRHPDHVLFGHAGIEILLRATATGLIEKCVAMIAG